MKCAKEAASIPSMIYGIIGRLNTLIPCPSSQDAEINVLYFTETMLLEGFSAAVEASSRAPSALTITSSAMKYRRPMLENLVSRWRNVVLLPKVLEVYFNFYFIDTFFYLTLVNDAVLGKFNLLQTDGFFVCPPCKSILRPTNLQAHMKRIHSQTITSREFSILRSLSSRDISKELVVRMATSGGWTASIPERPVLRVSGIPVLQGFRCSDCNVGDTNLVKLQKRHDKCKATNCANGLFLYASVQLVKFGRKVIVFGVQEAAVNEDDLVLTSEELEAARLQIQDLEEGNAEFFVNDGVDSPLYHKLGWFRFNPARSDFVDTPRVLLNQVSSYALKPEFAEKLLNFFKSRLHAVVEAHHQFLVMVTNIPGRPMLPIADANSSYARLFVDIFRFVFGLVAAQYRFPGHLGDNLNDQVGILQATLDQNRELNFTDVADLWGLLVEQKLEWMVDSILKMFIRFRSIEIVTGQLARGSSVEQMAAKIIYFCRLFQLNRLTSSTATDLAENCRKVQDYFHSSSSLFRQLCDVKRQARKVATDNDFRSWVILGADHEHFTVDGVEMDPAFLRRMYAGLRDRFYSLMGQLTVGVNFDFGSLRVHDNPADRTVSAMMDYENAQLKWLLISLLDRPESSVNRHFKTEDGSMNKEAVREYLALHDESCRVLCALIHVCSGMPGRATEIRNFRLKNSTLDRNFYFVREQIMTVSRSQKTNRRPGSYKQISRFLPPSLSKQVAAWIIVVRPLYQMLAKLQYGRECAINNFNFAFVNKGSCFTAKEVRTAFESASLQMTGRRLKFSMYRHVTHHYAKYVLRVGGRYIANATGEDDNRDFIEDLQMGHSSETADLMYGRNTSEAVSIPRGYIIEDYRKFSNSWHQYLGADHDIL